MNNGKITSCADSGCGWHCCEFKQGNYIVSLPNELDGKNIDHLEVIDDDYHGGKKLICKAKHPENCDGGYKPIDCRMYPLFPSGKDSYLSGQKCPLSFMTQLKHIVKCDEYMEQYKSDNPDVDIDAFLQKVEMVGYDDL